MDNRHDQLKALTEVDLFALFLFEESKGEPVESKVALAHMVLNRAKANFGCETIRDAILSLTHFIDEKASGSNLGILRLASGERKLALCTVIAELAVRGHLKNDPTGGATNYRRINADPSRTSRLTFLRRIGNHNFYKEPLEHSVENHAFSPEQSPRGIEL